jgi:hypothetical protein
MKTRDKIICVAVIGVVSVIAITAYHTAKVIKQLGEITLDLPNDPLLQFFIGTNKRED